MMYSTPLYGRPPHVAQMPMMPQPPAAMPMPPPMSAVGMAVRESYEPARPHPGRPMAMMPPAMTSPWNGAPPPAPLPTPAPVRPATVSMLQMAQEREGPDELRKAIDELGPHLSSLATHGFGNYLVS